MLLNEGKGWGKLKINLVLEGDIWNITKLHAIYTYN